jgi:hypothetical protein
MPLRTEERIPAAIPVYLICLNEPGAAERVLTENVSSHGARVIAKRRWPPREHHWITTLCNKTVLPARVVYCLPRPNGNFCVGLEFGEFSPGWMDEPSGGDA